MGPQGVVCTRDIGSPQLRGPLLCVILLAAGSLVLPRSANRGQP